jgi:Transcriptional regulator
MSTPCCPPRGEAKRQAVIAAAERAFLDQGYASASMDAIAADAGVSKRTVYNHFPSKQDLFRAVVARLYGELNDAERARLPVEEPPEEVLPRFARHLLAHLRRPEIQGLLRLIVAERPRFPELGLAFHAEGKGPAVSLLEHYLAAQHQRGILDVPDPWLAAAQFLGAIKEGVFWPALLGLPVAEDERVIGVAAASFLTVHRPRG